jgi:hypothetical protein
LDHLGQYEPGLTEVGRTKNKNVPFQRLRSRMLTAQINEALCKVLCHNLCVVIQSVHELGIETNFEANTAKPYALS